MSLAWTKRAVFSPGKLARHLEAPVTISALTLLVMLLADFVPSSVYGRLFRTSQLRGFLDDWQMFFVDFVLIPFLMYWYVAGPKFTMRLWNRLEDLAVIRIPSDKLTIVRSKRRSSRIALGGVLVCLITLWATWFSNSLLEPKPWWFANWTTLSIRLATWGVSYYVGCVVVLRELTILFDLRKVFSASSVELHPYHPDKNGGFGFVMDHLMWLTFLSAMFGTSLAIWEVWLWRQGLLASAHGWVAHTGLVIYVFLTPVGFFAPLISLHRIMLRAKEKLLEPIASQLQQFLETLAENKTDLTKSSEVQLKRAKELEELYSIIDKYPTWPFRVGEIWRFLLLLLGGISPLLSLVSSFLRQR